MPAAQSNFMKRVLFVCTGNIFRSAIAEQCLRHYLGPDSEMAVESAGTEANPQAMFLPVFERLASRGIDASGHRQRRIISEILQDADLVVAMGLDHREFLRQQFHHDAVLFHEVLSGKERPVLDVNEAIKDWRTNSERVIEYSIAMVDFVADSMPVFAQRVQERLRSND